MKAKLLLIFILFTNICFSQEPHPLDFFPHHEGDIFEYQIADSYFQNIITKDSLGDDGKYYIETSYYGKWIIDTLTYEAYQGTLLKIKLNADSGDVWIVDSNATGFIKAYVRDIFSTVLFNEDVHVKYIEYMSYELPDTINGFYAGAYDLANKFGLAAEYGDPPGRPTHFLRGAKINGIVYGTITSVKDEISNLSTFTLAQNYPNPFNPTTTIEYRLPNSSYVTLTIFNTLGEEVIILVDEHQASGSYKIDFNSRSVNGGFPSGVYMYRLTSDRSSVTKKMILIQ